MNFQKKNGNWNENENLPIELTNRRNITNKQIISFKLKN